ncbi:RNA polymerase sigma factor [Ureibacillus sp. MALMAid1270]|uniref:RNA polymerase sigma factor n=1 Tax=Ureibacillus sp. MALMAid1270 TaxID=3411629 RepID=UPI003BA52AFE
MIETWFEKYVELIYKYILFMVKDYQIAEDLTQETFIYWDIGPVKVSQVSGTERLSPMSLTITSCIVTEL